MTKRQHYVYLLTRTLPEGGCRYYVGIRTAPKGKTPETDTSYMGSGRAIRAAVKAHRAEFTKTILDVFDTREEARAMERVLVGLPTANSPWSYNLVTGGEDSGLASEETKAKLREVARVLNADPEYKARHDEANRTLARDPAWLAARSAGTRRRYEDPAAREETSAAALKRFEDPAECKKVGDGVRTHYANESSEARDTRIENQTAAARRPEKRAASLRYWASMTPAERSAENKRRAAVARENKRRKREVALIFLALVNYYHGSAEAA